MITNAQQISPTDMSNISIVCKSIASSLSLDANFTKATFQVVVHQSAAITAADNFVFG